MKWKSRLKNTLKLCDDEFCKLICCLVKVYLTMYMCTGEVYLMEAHCKVLKTSINIYILKILTNQGIKTKNKF